MALPLNIIILIWLIVAAIGLFVLKSLLFNRGFKFEPMKVRRFGITSPDSHKSWTLYEQEVEKWFLHEKIPHAKPEKAKIGEFYTKSAAVPYVVVLKNWESDEIHSIVYIPGLERPKSFPPLVRTPDSGQPKYPELLIDLQDFTGHVWRTKLFQYYADLRKQVKAWAKEKQH